MDSRLALLAGAAFFFLGYYYKDIKRAYGWLPDVPDLRDYLFIPREPGVSIKSTVNLSNQFPFPPENQGNIGSCTSHAISSALEYLKMKNGETPTKLSRLFGYYNTREISGTVNQDVGGTLRDTLRAANHYGVAPDPDWPYDVSKWKTKPVDKAYSDAASQLVTSYESLSTLDEMKKCLSEGYPFALGIQTYESFKSSEVAQTGVVNMPKQGEKVSNGHAVLAVGYDEPTQTFLIRNSWGTSWGMNGYFTLPLEYVNPDNGLARDFWVVRKDY